MFHKHVIRLALVETDINEYRTFTTLNGFCVDCGKAKSKRYRFDIPDDNDIQSIALALGWKAPEEFHRRL